MTGCKRLYNTYEGRITPTEDLIPLLSSFIPEVSDLKVYFGYRLTPRPVVFPRSDRDNTPVIAPRSDPRRVSRHSCPPTRTSILD